MPIIRKTAPGQLKADRMRMIYLRAEQQILKEITRKRNLGLVDYSDVAALQRVQEILRNMTTEAEEYAPVMIKMQFYGQEDFPSAPMGYENAGMLTSAQTAIVERLTENLMTDITFAAATAYESAENFLTLGRTEADRFRMLTLEEVARLEAEGKGWNTIQREMAAKLQAQGITSFVDRAGRKWGLTQYCSMATRTTQRQAQVAAALTADDWDLWQISKIGSTCPLCSTYEGRVYSKSGTDPDYPPLTMAFGKMDPAGMNDLSNSYLNIHPNCLHSLVRYTTAGKTDEQIQRDKDFSSFEKRPANVDYRSKRQIEAYRQKEAERAAFRRDMKQFNKYKAALGKDFPKTFETFEKHKKAGDEVYKEWERKYRELGKRASDIVKVEQAAQPTQIINPITPQPPKIQFVPAQTMQEAQLYAGKYIKPQFMDKTFKGQADFKGISLEHANDINKALTNVFEQFSDLDKISGVKVVSPKSSIGKKAFKSGGDALFSYDPIQHGIYVNGDILKNSDALSAYVQRAKEAWNIVANNLEKLSPAQRAVAEKYIAAGRSLVDGNTAEGLFTHELGHHVEWTLLDAKTNNEIGRRMHEYAPKISGYATASKSEYLAESFAAYMKGERDILDPDFVKYLDLKLKR